MAERGKIFKEAPILAPKRSWFDMSYENVFSFNIGECVPSAFYECLPSDHIKTYTGSLTRLAPLLAPVMHRLNQFNYHFYVRLRDIWTNFDKFITNNDQKKTWQQNTNFVPPQMPWFKPAQTMFSELNISNNFHRIASFNFGTGNGTVQWNAGSIDGYFLWVAVPKNSAAGIQTCYYWIDKKWYVAPGLSNTWTLDHDYVYYVFMFKAKPSEFDYSHIDSNGRNSDLYKLNPFSNGGLLDFLGISLDGVLHKQKNYYETFNSSTFFPNNCLTVNGSTSFSVMDNGISSGNKVKFVNQIPTTVSSSGSVDSLDFNFTNFGEFFDSHCVIEQWIFYTTSDNKWHINLLQYDGFGAINDDLNTVPAQSTNFIGDVITEDPISALPLRAYRFIYDEYFRDQNYVGVNPVTDFSRDGYEFTGSFSVLDLAEYLNTFRKCWEHDPYTSALPGPQRGDAVHFLPQRTDVFLNTQTAHSTDGTYKQVNTFYSAGDGSIVEAAYGTESGAHTVDAKFSVDLSAATIENFRWANSMQKYLEKKARTGGRYYEYLLGIWNKHVDDAKLNRPIYLDGEKNPIQISEVLQTSSTDFSTSQPLGDMAGRGISVSKDKFLEYECPDYGYFIEITTVIPRVSYQQGIARHFSRETYLDFPLPDFAQLGEEYVKSKELYYTGNQIQDNAAFGYQSRYYDFKYKRSEVHGDFKDSMNFWTFARIFDSKPVNGKAFLEVRPDYRQFAVVSPGFSHVYCQMWHDTQMNRALPEFGVPVL